MLGSAIFSSDFDWIHITLALLASYVAKYYYDYYTRANPLPGPFPLPIIGNFHQLILHNVGTIDVGTWIFHLHNIYGDAFEVYLGSIRNIAVGDPESLEKVYNPSSTNKFFTRLKLNGLSELGMQNGIIFNNNLISWRRSRKYISQALLSPKFLRGFTNTAQDMFKKVECFWKFGDIIDFSIWIKYYMADIAILTTTGKSGGFLSAYNTPKSEYTPEMIESKEFLERLVNWFASFPFFMAVPGILRRYCPGLSSLNKYYINNAKRLDNDLLSRVAERRKQLENLPEDQQGGPGLLDMLLTFNTTRDPNGYVKPTKYEEKPMVDEEIRDCILDTILTTFDTTGNTFCYFIYYMAHNPQYKKRLLEELDSIFGEDITRPVTHNDFEKLVFMEAAIKETLRIFPTVPLTFRSLSEPETLLGYNWPAGQLFFVSQYGIMNNRNVWKDPYKFDPDRFLKDAEKIPKKYYVPFGGGGRICPGRHMAMAELKTLFTLFYRKYDIDLVDKNAPLDFSYGGTFVCKKLMVKLNQRNRKRNIYRLFNQ